jgi:micrococcal nuclease
MRKLLTATLLLTAAAAFAKPAPKSAPPLEGKMIQVTDGATFTMLAADGSKLAVRLADIEPPELCQTWGSESRDALAAWLQDQPLFVRAGARDRAGRVLAHVEVDGTDINRRMVEEGHAFSVRSKWDRGPLVKQERMAQALRRGMFTAGLPETPASFRRSHGPCQPAP